MKITREKYVVMSRNGRRILCSCCAGFLFFPVESKSAKNYETFDDERSAKTHADFAITFGLDYNHSTQKKPNIKFKIVKVIETVDLKKEGCK